MSGYVDREYVAKKRYYLSTNSMERDKSPIVEKPSPFVTPSLDIQLQTITALAEQSRQKEIWRDEVEIKVQTRGLPFMLMPLADCHIGAKGVDYEALKRHFDFIKSNPVYTVLVGDLSDNFMPSKHPSAMMEDVETPTDQFALIRAFFKEYQDKILTSVGGGQHDNWTNETAGLDIHKWLSEDLNIPLLKSGGALKLKVDEQDYKVRLWHKIGRLNSQFNYTHAGKQALRLAGDDSDVIITADKHLGAVEETFIGDKKRTICQLGTFKVEDEFGRNMGLVQRPQPFYPVFLFFSGQHNIEAIENLGQAEEMIGMMKKYYKQLGVANLGMK